MTKKTKKVNVKEVEKVNAMEFITKTLEDNGYSVESGEDYGMTKGTIVIHANACDIQIKPITPKAGIDRYIKLEDEEEE